MRFHSAPVIRLGDGKPKQLGHVLKADGRWRMMAFAGAGDVGQRGGDIAGLCAYLEDDAASPVVRYTRAGTNIDSIIDVRAVFQAAHRDMMLDALPYLLFPRKGRYGLVDYEKAFCPDMKTGPDLFDLRGVDRAKGALVIVRPDQFIAKVQPLDDFEGIAQFFDGVLI